MEVGEEEYQALTAAWLRLVADYRRSGQPIIRKNVKRVVLLYHKIRPLVIADCLKRAAGQLECSVSLDPGGGQLEQNQTLEPKQLQM